MNKIFNTLSNLPPFFQDLSNCYPSEQESIDSIEAENAIIYGTPCYIIEKGKAKGGVFFLSEEYSDYICFANNETKDITRLSIKNIREMSFLDKSENLAGFNPISGHEYIQIMIGNKSYDLAIEQGYDLGVFKNQIVYSTNLTRFQYEYNF